MDPNKVVSEVPTTLYLNPDWTSVKPNPAPNHRQVKVLVRTYADGRKVNIVLNDDGSELSQLGGVSYDDDQRKVWEQDSRKSNSASPDETISAPPTQKQIAVRKPDGSIVWQDNPNYQPPDPVKAKKEVEDQREREWNQANGNGYLTHEEVRQKKRQEDADATAKTEKDRQTAIQKQNADTAAANAANQTKKTDADLAMGQVVKLDNGRYAQIRVGADGKLEVSEVPTPKTAGTAVGTLNLTPGQLAADFSAKFQTINARRLAGEITAEEALKELEPLHSLYDTAIKEQQGTITNQLGIYNAESANYGRQLDDATNRRTFASTMFGTAAKGALDLNDKITPGSTAGGRALLAQLMLGAQYADVLGGLDRPTAPKLSQGLVEAKSQGILPMTADQQAALRAPQATEMAAAPAPAPAASFRSHGPLADPAALALGQPGELGDVLRQSAIDEARQRQRDGVQAMLQEAGVLG